MDKEKLKENNINYPIKLEYYKIKDVNEEYGIEIVKTEYKEDYVKIENDIMTKITKEEENINRIIHKLKENEVTPTGFKDSVEELMMLEKLCI